MTEPGVDVPKDRSAALSATRKKKLDDMFKGKKFEILREIHLDGDQKFQTPFGNKGRNGFALREIGNPENKFVIGVTMLRHVAKTYGAVEMPPRKRRSSAQKAADDAEQAELRARAIAASADLGANSDDTRGAVPSGRSSG